MRSLAVLLCALAAPSLVHADQCEVVSPDVARWAQKLLVVGASFVMRCEPCDDKSPTPPMAIKRVNAKPWSGDKTQMTISLNGKEVDLAYTYVQTGPNTYANLAALTGCPASGVSPFWSPIGNGDDATAGFGDAGQPPPQVKKDRSPIGVPNCDAFMKKYETCVKTKFPQEARQAALDAIDQMRDAWRDASKTPDGRNALNEACKQATDSVREAMASMGCTF